MRTVGRAYFLHLRINANEFSHECYNNGVDTIFHSHRNHNMLTMSLCYQKYILRLACYSKSDIYTYEQEKLRKYSTTFSGTALKPFCINKFIHVNNRNPSS